LLDQQQSASPSQALALPTQVSAVGTPAPENVNDSHSMWRMMMEQAQHAAQQQMQMHMQMNMQMNMHMNMQMQQNMASSSFTFLGSQKPRAAFQ